MQPLLPTQLGDGEIWDRGIARMRLSVILRISSLLIFLMTLSLIFGACEPLVEIKIRNETDQTLRIFTGNTFIDSAAPGREVIWEIESIYPKYNIIAKDMDGNSIYAKTFTQEELKRNKWRVVIPPTAKSVEQSDNVTGK